MESPIVYGDVLRLMLSDHGPVRLRERPTVDPL
jgi:hypothetical protein